MHFKDTMMHIGTPYSMILKAISDYIFNIIGGVSSWRSNKQTLLAQSVIEYEMITLPSTSEEVSLSRCLLAEIPLWEKPIPIMLIHCNSNKYYCKNLETLL